jgi:circadian clock protein KaiB
MAGKNKSSPARKGGAKKKVDATKQIEKAISRLGKGRYLLRLYVAGTTPRSTMAIANLKSICEEHLADGYDLEVIDIYQQPALGKGEQIIAVPTLIKKLPPPVRKLIGDMSDMEKVLVGLDIRKKDGT